MRSLATITIFLLGLAAQAFAGPIEDGQKGLRASEKGDEYLAIYYHARVIFGEGVSDKNRTIAYFNRGLSHQRTSQYKEAIADYDEVLKRDPAFGSALTNRGKVYFSLGDLERALADLDQAIATDPKDYKAYGTRALIYERWGLIDKAVADLQMRARLGDDAWWVLSRLSKYGGTG